MRRVALFGGGFNPVHIGHLRLVLETAETLGPHRIEILPTPVPPHKDAKGLLPFEFRCELIAAALEELAPLPVPVVLSDRETGRQGPSYTVDTLADFRAEHPDETPIFVVGATELTALPGWKRGLDIPRLADLAVFPRRGRGLVEFFNFARSMRAEPIPNSPIPACSLPETGRRLLYIPAPEIGVSSSLVRERFLANRRLDHLVPKAVFETLKARRKAVEALWRR